LLSRLLRGNAYASDDPRSASWDCSDLSGTGSPCARSAARLGL